LTSGTFISGFVIPASGFIDRSGLFIKVCCIFKKNLFIMKRLTTAASGIFFLLVVAACNDSGTKVEAANTPAGDSSEKTNIAAEPPASTPVDSATMMKNWQAYMTPGEPHKTMTKFNGTWNTEVTSWMAPGAPPEKSKGTAVQKTILNGLYQTGTYKGTIMNMPFEGMSTLAYDNHKKVFESTWIDNMGSGIMHLQGSWDEATKTMTLSGKMINPGDGKECTVRESVKVVDDNTHVMEMYAPGPDGKEFKTMEIVYKRTK
jgi:hypothetical protein